MRGPTKLATQSWLMFRQIEFEGGFQGRTNKLVDGCYSFWQGGAIPILEIALKRRHGPGLEKGNPNPCNGRGGRD